jgi:hypothetical protein
MVIAKEGKKKENSKAHSLILCTQKIGMHESSKMRTKMK